MTNVKRLIERFPGLGGIAKHLAYEDQDATLRDLRVQLQSWLAFVDDVIERYGEDTKLTDTTTESRRE